MTINSSPIASQTGAPIAAYNVSFSEHDCSQSVMDSDPSVRTQMDLDLDQKTPGSYTHGSKFGSKFLLNPKQVPYLLFLGSDTSNFG